MELAHRLRVYVVTREGGDHLAIAQAACEGGAGTVQLRAPELDPDELTSLAVAVVAACRQAGVLCVVNDDLAVAAEVGADGVHLGQRDRGRWGDTWHVVRRRAAGLVLGISVEDAAQAREATGAGADYLGVTVHPTLTKHDARAVGLDALRDIVASTALPVVAIGGIDADNAAEVLAAGAAGVAIISAVADAADPVAAVRGLVAATT